MPKVFPLNTINIMRMLTFLSTNESAAVVEKTSRALWQAYWGNEEDISSDEKVTAVLSRDLKISNEKANEWMSKGSLPEVKERLKQVTQEAIDAGAFGAPTFIVTNSKGERQLFWGSDRFDHIDDFIKNGTAKL
jgi:2-hydroxychromene-2-carboxylate isomerase